MEDSGGDDVISIRKKERNFFRRTKKKNGTTHDGWKFSLHQIALIDICIINPFWTISIDVNRLKIPSISPNKEIGIICVCACYSVIQLREIEKKKKSCNARRIKDSSGVTRKNRGRVCAHRLMEIRFDRTWAAQSRPPVRCVYTALSVFPYPEYISHLCTALLLLRHHDSLSPRIAPPEKKKNQN